MLHSIEVTPEGLGPSWPDGSPPRSLMWEDGGGENADRSPVEALRTIYSGYLVSSTERITASGKVGSEVALNG